MRIALIAHVMGFADGQGRVSLEVARGAINAGIDVVVVAESCIDELAQDPRVTFVKISRSKLPIQLLRNLSFALRSARWLKHNRSSVALVQGNGFITFARVDIVVAHFVHTAWLKNPYASFNSGIRSVRSAYEKAYALLNSRWERKAFSRAQRIIAVSDHVAEELIQAGVQVAKIKTIFNGVSIDEFQPRGSERSHFRLPANVPLLLFAGDLRTSRKNLESVLRALIQLDGVHLAVAGDTKRSPYPSMTETMGLAKRVHFLGKTKEMARLMNSVDAFVFPSRYDPLGLVVLEAMASGLPVVTSSTTGAAALLDDVYWTIKDPDDVDALVYLLRRLAEEPELRRELGERNRARAINFDWTHMSSKYVACFGGRE